MYFRPPVFLGLAALYAGCACAPAFAEQVGHLLVTLAASDQLQAVQPTVVARLVGAGDFLLDGDSHQLRVSNFQLSHGSTSETGNCQRYSPLMRHYIMSLCLRNLCTAGDHADRNASGIDDYAQLHTF